MILYLVQHGVAESADRDASRPLTPDGREAVSRIAGALARARLPVEAIYHSGKLRAKQTAEIFGASLGPPGGVAQFAGLHPNDDPAIVQSRLQDLPSRTMLVGHLPHMARLASLLLLGEPDHELVVLRNAAVLGLHVADDSLWRVTWYLLPELVV